MVLVVGALVIGGWVSRAIRDGVVDRTGEVAALFVDSFISPELQDHPFNRPFPPEMIQRLDQLLDTTSQGGSIVSFKVWSGDGVLRYAIDRGLTGKVFAPAYGVAAARDGRVTSHISNLSEPENRYEAARWSQLLETYAPVRSTQTGEVIGVAEFYQLSDDLLADIRSSQRTGWIIVGTATFVMFLLLNGLVRSASRTIRRQTTRLQELTHQLRSVSAAKVETDEALLRRVAQDLHDGPAQGLALANLRMGAVQAATRDSPAAADVGLIAKAVDSAFTDVRQISAQMRLPDLRGLSLHDVIASAAEQHQARAGERVAVDGQGGNRVPGGPAATTIFRVVTQALNNAARHAGPGTRRVHYDWSHRACTVRVEDDGIGFDPERTREGLGLRGMRERAQVLGGRLAVKSRAGAGTVVELVLPEDAL